MGGLPHPRDVLRAYKWLFAGAPIAGRDFDAKACALTLYHLLEALPEHVPLYNHGSPEWRRAMGIPEQPEESAPTIQQATAELAAALRDKPWFISAGIGEWKDEPAIFLYVKRRAAQNGCPVGHWRDFRIIRRYTSPPKPARQRAGKDPTP